MIRIAGEHNLPPENLITPDSVRRLAWTPPEEITEATVAETLRGLGAREWQIGLLAADLTEALTPTRLRPPLPSESARRRGPATTQVDRVGCGVGHRRGWDAVGYWRVAFEGNVPVSATLVPVRRAARREGRITVE